LLQLNFGVVQAWCPSGLVFRKE